MSVSKNPYLGLHFADNGMKHPYFLALLYMQLPIMQPLILGNLILLGKNEVQGHCEEYSHI